MGEISSLEEVSVLFGTDLCRRVPPALISLVQLTGCWRHDTRDGSTLLHSELFLSRCLSHSASWEQLFCPLSCWQSLQWLSSSSTYAVFTNIYLAGGYAWSAWSVLSICLCYSPSKLEGRSGLYKYVQLKWIALNCVFLSLGKWIWIGSHFGGALITLEMQITSLQVCINYPWHL